MATVPAGTVSAGHAVAQLPWHVLCPLWSVFKV
jgi:hypothetical protein